MSYMTAAHLFSRNVEYAILDDSDGSNFEFSPSDGEESDPDPKHQDPGNLRAQDVQTPSYDFAEEGSISIIHIGTSFGALEASKVNHRRLEISFVDGKRPRLDYALFKAVKAWPASDASDILSADLTQFEWKPVRDTKYQQLDDSDVLILASSNDSFWRSGKLSGTPSFKNPAHGAPLQELWTVHVQGELAIGDCGSWVVDCEDRTLYEHKTYLRRQPYPDRKKIGTSAYRAG